MNRVEKLWELLGDIPINEEEEIDIDFKDENGELLFEKGTDRYEIWHWFEEKFNVRIVDLMGIV